MQGSLRPSRLTRSRRAHLLAGTILVSLVLVAGCGASGATTPAASTGRGTTSVASTGRTTTSASASGTATSGRATSSEPNTPAGLHEAALEFANCMRANGVPNFPDPNPGGGFLFNADHINPSAPAVTAAQAKCRSLLPGGGPPVPGTTTHPSAQTLAKLVNIAQCMRDHGVPDFPDPRTSVPRNPFGSGAGVITDYDGAILLFPHTLNMESPAYLQAAAACGTLAGKLGHGPHSRP